MSKLPYNDSVVDESYIDILHTFLTYTPGWMDDAACIGLEKTFNKEDILAACDLCPVKKECLDYALENNVSTGVFGGKVFPLDSHN